MKVSDKMARILIVEDESIVAMEIQDRLKSLGYSVVDAISSGEKAIKKAGEAHPDLVLMDIRLKGKIDGIETAKQIRNRFDIPVIYLTAYADDETLKRARIAEPYGYILKPFEERELRSNIEVALYKHKVENKLRENENHLKNIINSTSEMIFSFDENNRISTWNKTAEIITGYKRKEVIQKPVNKLNVFDNPQELLDKIGENTYGKEIVFDRIFLRAKKGVKKIIQVTRPAIITGGKNQNFGVVFVGRDITHEHENLDKLFMGNSYSISDKNNRSALELLKCLARSDHKCLLITRSNPEIIKGIISTEDIQVILFKKDTSGEYEIVSDLEGLIAKIEQFSSGNAKSVILLDRIDYLLIKSSFEQFVESLYQITDIILNNNSLLLLHINPSVLDKRQTAIIEDELQLLPNQQIRDLTIRDDLFDILKFLLDAKQRNSIVSLKNIKRDMSLTYPTISKRLRQLEDKDLVYIKKQGRSKTAHISKKGEMILNKRKLA